MSDPIQEYCISNGLKKSSTQSITYMLKHYERFQETTLSELIEEAEEEEDKGIRWKHRKLKRRLISYTNHLQQTMMYSSAVVISPQSNPSTGTLKLKSTTCLD